MADEMDAGKFDFEAVFEADDYLYFYAESLTDERTEKEVEALVRLLNLDNPLKILDLACGYGRHANRLAALGHQVTGIDLMPDFLEVARQQAQERGVEVNYQQGDMRSIQYDASFDRVMLLFTAFGYFEDEQNLLVLKNIYRALVPGGVLIFDVHNRDVFLKNYQPFYVMEVEGNLMIDRGSFDSSTGRWYNRRIVIRDGVRRDKPFFVRLYNPNEMRDLLQKAGFSRCDIYGGWDARPVSADSNRMIIMARREND